MKHTIKLLTLAAILTAVFGLTGCPGPVNNYIEPEYTITVNVTNGTALYSTTAKAGETVTITATANEGFVFDVASSAFSIPDYSVTNNGTVITWNLVMPAENVTINVTFKEVVEDNTTVDDGNTDPTDEIPTEDTPTEDTPTDTNGDGEEDTPVVDNGEDEEETEGNETDNGSGETTTHTHNYEGGGCDVEGCEQRYEFDDYQIEAYIYKVINDELVQIDTLYFSFDSSNLISSIETVTDWGEDKPGITIPKLIHLKGKYINATVAYYTGSDIGTLNLDDFNALLAELGEDWDWSNYPYPLDGLDTNSPINIVIE